MANAYDSWRTGIQIDNIYPVGSIYMSINSTNPHNLFGGSWEEINNTFLVAQGTSYLAGSTGGSASSAHTHEQVAVTTGGSSAANSGSTALTTAQMPAHSHAQYANVGNAVTGSGNLDDIAGCNNINAQDVLVGARRTTTEGGGEGHTHTIAHTHSIAATTTGEASNTNNLPPYLAVYMWKRIA